MRVVVIGIGNAYRDDDAVGLFAAGRIAAAAPPGVEVYEHDGEPARLIDLWEGADAAYVVDAVRGDRPGTIHRIAVGEDAVPDAPRRDSSHAVGIGDAVELARALGRLPRRLVLFGVEGFSFGAGHEMSSAVRRAGADVAKTIVREIETALASS